MNKIFLLLTLCFAINTNAETVLTVSRYMGMKGFNKSRESAWIKTATGYTRAEIPQLSSNSSCNLFVNIQQKFPLSQMVDGKYITAEQAKEFESFGSKLHPSQVTFYKISHSDLPHIIDKKITNEVEQFLVAQETPTHASLWSISGQAWMNEEQKIGIGFVPWQMEPKFNEASKLLDRNKYPFVWEWGRAAQVKAGDIDELLAAATIGHIQELTALGRPIEDGWVTLHSLDAAHTRAYEMRFKNRIFYRSKENPNEVIFLVPLKEVIAQVKPFRFSENLSTLEKMGLHPEEAVSWVQYFKNTELAELNYKTSSGTMSKHPLIVLDISDHHAELVNKMLKKLPAKTQEDVEQTLNRLNPDSFLAEHPSAIDYGITPQTKDYLSDLNGILITNINPVEVAKDADHVAKHLVSVLSQKIEELHMADPTLTYDKIKASMIKQKLNFVVSSFEEKTIAQAKTLKPTENMAIKVSEFGHSDAMTWFQAIMKNGAEAAMKPKVKMLSWSRFSAEDLFKLVEQNAKYRAWLPQKPIVYNYGFQSKHRYMMNPDLF